MAEMRQDAMRGSGSGERRARRSGRHRLGDGMILAAPGGVNTHPSVFCPFLLPRADSKDLLSAGILQTSGEGRGMLTTTVEAAGNALHARPWGGST